MSRASEQGAIRLLILGGYGVFGGRLAQLLSDCSEIDMLIAGRDKARASAFCKAFVGAASVQPVQLDRADIAEALDAFQPDLVVDASGPFQDYGGEQYGVVDACIAHGCDYLDLADGAEFVRGIGRFDDAAKAADVVALSGVSSFPVLTAAVLRDLAKDIEVHEVEAGIAPSPHAGIGLNVMRAVVGYAGSPVTLMRSGVMTSAPGLAESRRATVAVPGRLPLRNIRFSLVEVPDLQVLPPEYPGMTDMWVGAGPVPESLHRMLNALAKARALLKLPSLTPFAPLFYRVLNLMKFGEHRGGMYVRVRGVRDGEPAGRSWHLLAEGDDGPFIPSMAVEALVRKMLQGERPASGARPAIHALELGDYMALFANRSIETGTRDDLAKGPVYREVLGSAFDALPDQVRALHGSNEDRSWSGVASVKRSSNPLARLVAAIVGFPKAAESVPVTVAFTREGDGELWTRTFGEETFSSHQAPGRGRNKHLVVERFGPIAVAMALVVEDAEGDTRLTLIPRRWSAFGIPMPRLLLPRGTIFETEQDGQFIFDVEVKVPLVGRVVAYRGTLNADDAISSPASPATLPAI